MADGSDKHDGSNSKLRAFLHWCKSNNLCISEKVEVRLKGSCHRYGMVATQPIQANECLFTIPRGLLLHPKSSSIADSISDVDEDLTAASGRGSGWVPLLLALIFEYTNSKSFWQPYLDIVPELNELDQPMFWNEKDRERLLKDTEIVDDVEKDLKCIEKEYNEVVKAFIRNHQDTFDLKTHSLDLYKRLASFVMAYSFTETGHQGKATPVMVPMADMLNHHSNNNARLEFAEAELKMVSTQPIAKGEEVFNTYGQLANCHLLQSYGFVEKTPNPHDSIEVSVDTFYKVGQKHVTSKHEARLNDAKYQFMEEMGLVNSTDSFVFDLKGCQQGMALFLFLQFLHLSESELHMMLNYEEENLDVPNDLNDLISHFHLCSEEQRVSSYKNLMDTLKLKERKRINDESSDDEESNVKSAKRTCFRLNQKDNMYSENGYDGYSSGEGYNDSEDDNRKYDRDKSNGINNEHDDDYIDNESVDSDAYDDDDDEDCTQDGSQDASDRGDNEEDEEPVHMTYEQMSEFPLKWRLTLSRVAKDCALRIDALLKEKKLDKEKDLSSREHAIKHMLSGLKEILCYVAKLESNST